MPPPLYCKSPLCVEGERAPFSADQSKEGQLFSGGALISIVLRQENSRPPFPIEITVLRKSVPKPRGGGLSLNPSVGHVLPQPGKLLATEQLY